VACIGLFLILNLRKPKNTFVLNVFTGKKFRVKS
jgi:hypothetical protein